MLFEVCLMVGPWSLCTRQRIILSLRTFPLFTSLLQSPEAERRPTCGHTMNFLPLWSLPSGCLCVGDFLIYLMIKWLQHPLGRFQMTCFISWLLSSFSEGRKNFRETCWFLKSRKCVACVKPDSYLLISTCNSLCSWRTSSTGKAWNRQNLPQVFFLPPPPHLGSSASCISSTQENMYFQGFFFF